MDIDYIILMSHLIHLYVIQDHKLFTLRFILNGLGYFFCLGLWSTLILVYGTRCRQWHPTPVLLPGKSHGQGSLVGCSPWGHYKLDTTERLHFHFSLSCIGEGNEFLPGESQGWGILLGCRLWGRTELDMTEAT